MTLIEDVYRAHYRDVRKRLMGKISKSVMTDIPEAEEVKVTTNEWWLKDLERRHKKQLELEQRKAEAIQRAIEKFGHAPIINGRFKIMENVAAIYGFKRKDLLVKNRTKKYVSARRTAIHAIKRAYPKTSLPEIGRLFGGLDHTTVLHALQKPDPALNNYDGFAVTRRIIDLQAKMPDWALLARDNTP